MTAKCLPQILPYLDRATGLCACGFSTGEQFGDRRTAKAKQKLMLHLEAALTNEFQIKDGSPLDCPECGSNLDLTNDDKGLLTVDQPSVLTCENGHWWDAYYRNKTLFLFVDDYQDGPFSTV